MTSVAYADYTPVSVAGRLSARRSLGGVVVLSVPSPRSRRRSYAADHEEMDGHVAPHHLLLCGWNAYAERVLDALFAAHGGRVDVVLVNELPEDDE